MVNFLPNPHTLHEGELWGVFCEYKFRLLFCLRFSSAVCNIMLYKDCVITTLHRNLASVPERLTHWRWGKMTDISSDYIFTCNFLNENCWISNKISLKYVPWGLIDNMSALVQIMAWRQTGNKPLSDPMMTHFTDTYMHHPELTHWPSVRNKSGKVISPGKWDVIHVIVAQSLKYLTNAGKISAQTISYQILVDHLPPF